MDEGGRQSPNEAEAETKTVGLEVQKPAPAMERKNAEKCSCTRSGGETIWQCRGKDPRVVEGGKVR